MDLATLKALADDTRYSVYRELTNASAPLSAQELADRLGVHANTVRMHLDRLRTVGLVEVESVHRGTVGRPQHSFSAAVAPTEADTAATSATLLAGLLGTLAERTGATKSEAISTGRSWGREVAAQSQGRGCLPVLDTELSDLGFSPEVGRGDGTSEGGVRIEFLQCPFRELAEAYPELICNLHRGLCEGVVDFIGGGRVLEFSTLYDPEPCHVTVATATK